MKTPSEELAAVRLESDNLKLKIVKLKLEAQKTGLPPDQAQMYEIEQRLSIIMARLDMLGLHV